MAATDEQSLGLAVPAHDQPLYIVLDLVHPFGPGGRFVGQGRNAGGDKVTPNVGSDHACEIAACRRWVELSTLTRNTLMARELFPVLRVAFHARRVPERSDDVTVYLVLNDRGASGVAYAETDPAEAHRETIIRNFLSGQYGLKRAVIRKYYSKIS